MNGLLLPNFERDLSLHAPMSGWTRNPETGPAVARMTDDVELVIYSERGIKHKRKRTFNASVKSGVPIENWME